MQQTNIHEDAEFAKLQATYLASWRRFSLAVSRFQLLGTEVEADGSAVRDAEMAVDSAQEEYRDSRNAFAKHFLEHSPIRGVLVDAA